MSKKRELLKVCKQFIKNQEITCAEAIYQRDDIIEHVSEFLESICAIVGYHKRKDKKDKEDA